MLINNGDKAGELISGNAGIEHFCRNCEQYEKCDYKKNKILDCNKNIIEFSNEIDGGFKFYVWEGNFMNQPEWWFTLLKLADKYKAEIRKENADGN